MSGKRTLGQRGCCLISTGFEKLIALGFAFCDPKIVARYAEPFARDGGGCLAPEDSVVVPTVTDLTPSGVGSAGFALATVAQDDEEPS